MKRILFWFCSINLIVSLVIGYSFVLPAYGDGAVSTLIYLHFALIGQMISFCLLIGCVLGLLSAVPLLKSLTAFAAVVLFSLLNIFLIVDRLIYSFFRFHFKRTGT